MAYHVISVNLQAEGPDRPLMEWVTEPSDNVPNFDISLPSGSGDYSDAQEGDILVIEFCADGNGFVSPTTYYSGALTSGDLVGPTVSKTAASGSLADGVYDFRCRLERGTTPRVSEWSAVEEVTISASVYAAGPGDLNTYLAWYGTRAYTAAHAASGVQVCMTLEDADSGSGSVVNMVYEADGGLNLTTLAGLIASGHRVSSLKDQSGNGRHLNQATHANRPRVGISGDIVYLTGSAGISVAMGPSAGSNFTQAPPYGWTRVGNRGPSGGTFSQQLQTYNNAYGIGVTSGDVYRSLPDSASTVPSTAGAWEAACSMTASGSASKLKKHLTLETGIGGTANTMTTEQLYLFFNSSNLDKFVEGGLIGSDFSANFTNIISQAEAFWVI